MKIVNQETLVPLGLAIVLIGTVATWVESVRSGMQGHSDQLEILTRNHDAHIKLVMEINSRLSRIEWAIAQERENGRKTRN